MVSDSPTRSRRGPSDNPTPGRSVRPQVGLSDCLVLERREYLLPGHFLYQNEGDKVYIYINHKWSIDDYHYTKDDHFTS